MLGDGVVRALSFARGAVLEADGSERPAEPAGGADAAPSALERDRAILRAREAGAPGLYEQLEARKEEQAALRRAPAARGLASDDAAFLNEAAEAARRRELTLQAAETDELAAFAEARKAAAAVQIATPGARPRTESDSNADDPAADQADLRAQTLGERTEFHVLKKRRRTAATALTALTGVSSLESRVPTGVGGRSEPEKEHTAEHKTGHQREHQNERQTETGHGAKHKTEHKTETSSLLMGYASSDSDD
jgi:ribosomal protein L29